MTAVRRPARDIVGSVLVEPVSPDEVARRLVGRQRPAPPWRWWTLIDLRRRRLARLLADEVADAQERGDDAVAELLDPVADALDSLVEPAEGIQK